MFLHHMNISLWHWVRWWWQMMVQNQAIPLIQSLGEYLTSFHGKDYFCWVTNTAMNQIFPIFYCSIYFQHDAPRRPSLTKWWTTQDAGLKNYQMQWKTEKDGRNVSWNVEQARPDDDDDDDDIFSIVPYCFAYNSHNFYTIELIFCQKLCFGTFYR